MRKMINKKNKIKQGISDDLFNTILLVIVTIIFFIVLYPIIYVLSSSFSSGTAVSGGQVLLWPVDFSLVGYKLVFKNKMIWTGYLNSFIYVILGTLLHLVMTICLAYPLSRKNYQGKPFVVKYMTVSMLFGGGLIPGYILVSNLGLVDTRTWMIINGAVGISHAIMMRTFFQSNVPNELLESAKMDGISDIGFLLKITLPLSKAVISVISLYAIVGRWNNFFTPMLYLQDRNKYPLQLVVNEILTSANMDVSQIQDAALLEQMASAVDAMKYSLIVVSTVPMLVLYPFVQKFFEKGVTIGSVKG